MTAQAQSKTNHSHAAIEFNNVTLAFNGPPVLDALSLRIDAGETVVIFGESGSGKSTMLMLALGLLHPNQGDVCVFGERVSGRSERRLRKLRERIGIVFQHGALFDSETVYDNVGFRLRQKTGVSADALDREVQEKLSFVGLDDYAHRYPGELSGGQRKRVAIARALVGDPEIILYDEPTTGLDPITARKVLDVLRRIRNELGTTSVVVTHELHYAYSVARRVVLLRNGGIGFDDTPAAFRASTDPYIMEFRSMAPEET